MKQLQSAFDLKEVIASVNAINLPRLDSYLNQLASDNINPLIQKWIKSNLRNWILREENPNKIQLTDRNQFSKLGIHIEPPWLAGKPLPPNLYFIPLNPALKGTIEFALHHIIYMIAVEQAKDVSKISVPDAVRLGVERHEEERKRLEDEHYERDGVTVIAQVSGKFKWVSIITKKGFERESKYMGHCLGTPGHINNYWVDVEQGRSQIWSLRDEQNMPHVTVEYFVTTKSVLQIRSKGANDMVGGLGDQFTGMNKRYWKPCLELFHSEYGKEHIKRVRLAELRINFPETVWRPYMTGITVDKPD